MKKTIQTTLAVGTLLLAWATASYATTIPDNLAVDFRKSPWFDTANIIAPFEHGGLTNRTSMTYDGITVSAHSSTESVSYLSSYSDDGFGVWNTPYGNDIEMDEIDTTEWLSVVIDGGMELTGAWLTDLFYSDHYEEYNNTTGPTINEFGYLIINGTQRIDFATNDASQINNYSNGVYWVSFGGSVLVNTIDFYADLTNIQDEYSVAGLTTVPEPATMLLFGSGLAGLAGLGRRKIKK